MPKDFKVVTPEEITGFDKETLERISQMKSSQLAISPDENYKAYQRYLRQNNWIDFDDILREALILLEDENIANQLRKRYRHIMVDEYQDSNIIQNALLKALVSDGVLLTAIGDANQSIYGFRGSKVELFKRFEKDFSPAHDPDLAGKLSFSTKFACRLRADHGRCSTVGPDEKTEASSSFIKPAPTGQRQIMSLIRLRNSSAAWI